MTLYDQETDVETNDSTEARAVWWGDVFWKALKGFGQKANTKRQKTFSFTHADTRPIYLYLYLYLHLYIYIYIHIVYHIQPFFSRKLVIHGNSYCDHPKILLPQLRGPGKPPWRFPPVAAPGLTDQIGISHDRKLETATGEAASFGWQGFLTLKSDSCWDTCHSVGKNWVEHGIHSPCGSLGEVQFFKKKLWF